MFNEAHIDPRRCQQVITKLLYLLTQGEKFTKNEASDVFFSVTKLFQHKDLHLRRMVYLCIKEFIPSSDEVIIITSSLMKDMNSSNDLFRANAIRVLCKIIDSQMLLQIERYLKQAVVDKSAVVASAVLAGATQLAVGNADVIKRWNSEIQEALMSKHNMVQFHAVALQHALRSNDRLAINKLVTQLTRGGVRSSMAQLLLVRYVAQVIAESGAPSLSSSISSEAAPRPFYDFMESCLRHKSELVIIEAARAIANMRDVTTRELTPAVTVLQLFLSSSKPVLRFAAIRTLNKIAMAHPMAVTGCNIDMEALISDPNRSIATLAITTLLKTGNESSIDRLLKQIGGFMGELADEFKVVVVQAIKALCLKFPSKHRGLLSFLSSILREDGGFEYKATIVEAILAVVREIPEATEAALSQLAEFIEDCEFTYLSVLILNILGTKGPQTKDPARYIRYIYNRVILENAAVRAAALTSLTQFAVACPDLRSKVMVLLRRALYDGDDEVRDRATLYLSQLDALSLGTPSPLPSTPLSLHPKALEASLMEYVDRPAAEAGDPFDVSVVPTYLPPEPKSKSKVQHGFTAVTAVTITEEEQNKYHGKNGQDEFVAQLKTVPQLAGLGPVFRTSAPVQLTEEETEYKVVAVHHVLKNHDVFQFHITNTVKEQVLEEVGVAMDLADAPQFEEVESIPLGVAPTEGAGQAYVVLSRGSDRGDVNLDEQTETGPHPSAVAAGVFRCVLRFRVKEIDPTTGETEEEGFDDEYQLEELTVSAADYINPWHLPRSFAEVWEDEAVSGGEEGEVVDSYALGRREGLQDTVEAVVHLLGMAVAEGTDAVPPTARSHTVLLAGTVVGGIHVMARVSFGIDASKNVAMKLAVRSQDIGVCEALHEVIQGA